jgi:hypothetical protein
VIAPCAVKLPQDPRSLEELWIADKLLNPKDRDYILPQQQVPLDKDRCDVFILGLSNLIFLQSCSPVP